MKLMTTTFLVMALAVGCGKGKGAAADDKGPPCSEAAANYIAIEMQQKLDGHLQRLKPTPEQLKAATAAIEQHCLTSYSSLTKKNTGWSGKARACVVAAKPPTEIGTNPVADCWKPERGASLGVSQVLFDFAKAEEAKAAAAAPPPPPPADPAAGTGSAAPTDPAAGTGSAVAPTPSRTTN